MLVCTAQKVNLVWGENVDFASCVASSASFGYITKSFAKGRGEFAWPYFYIFMAFTSLDTTEVDLKAAASTVFPLCHFPLWLQ